MSSTANWSYTAQATIWRCLGRNEDGILTFDRPVVIKCDYGMNARKGSLDIGRECVIKNTIWTEYGKASVGDYLLIGKSSEADPISAAQRKLSISSALPIRLNDMLTTTRCLRVVINGDYD